MTYSGTYVTVTETYILMPTLKINYLRSYYYNLRHLLMLNILLQYLRDVFILAACHTALSIIMHY